MPLIRKLDQSESDNMFKSTRVVDLSEYVDALRDLSPGDSAELPIPTNSTRRKETRNFNLAAKNIGSIKLKWKYQGAPGAESLFLHVVDATSNGTGRKRKAAVAAGE